MYVMESGSDSGHVFMVLFLQGREGKRRGALNHQRFSIVLLEAMCARHNSLMLSLLSESLSFPCVCVCVGH